MTNSLHQSIFCECCGKHFSFKNDLIRSHIRCPLCSCKVVLKNEKQIKFCFFFSLSALILSSLLFFLPILKITGMGLSSSVTLGESIYQMAQLYPVVAVFSFLFAMAFPLVYLVCVFTLSASELYGISVLHREKILRLLHHLQEWYMLDVYFVAVLVALVKLVGMFDLYLLEGFYILGIVSLLIFLVDLNYSPFLFEDHKNSLKSSQNNKIKTVALLLTALVFYLPANIFPIMVITALNRDEPSTIFQGIVLFFENKMYFIGVVIFLASVVIPVFKIFSLFYLLFTTSSTLEACRKKMKLFHFVEKVGKWSMVDIFVICVLAGVVDLGFLFKIQSGPGASFFTLVVIITVWATKSFDLQNIWVKQRINYEAS